MNKKQFLIGISIIFLIIVCFGKYLFINNDKEKTVPVVTNFEECMLAGNPILESYPRQCILMDKKHFTEYIGNILEKTDIIRLVEPAPNTLISNTFFMSGEARGNWYFEGSFPVILVDSSGKILAQGVATAKEDWMTTQFVPFSATLTFNPEDVLLQHSNKGTLILKKDNPSGLPENNDALTIPVKIK